MPLKSPNHFTNSRQTGIPFVNLKKEFLRSMKSPKGYKRYLGSPLRYAGGKSLAVAKIIKCFPDCITKKLVSPFLGGGSIEVALAKEMDIKVIAYDLFYILVNYWQVQMKNPKELYSELKKLKPTKKVYAEIKACLKKHWLKEISLNKLDLASHYFFNHNLSYGPGFLGWMSKIYENKTKYQKTIEKVRDFKSPNLQVRQGSFEKILPQYSENFLYLDPPYFLEGDSKMFKGIYP